MGLAIQSRLLLIHPLDNRSVFTVRIVTMSGCGLLIVVEICTSASRQQLTVQGTMALGILNNATRNSDWFLHQENNEGGNQIMNMVSEIPFWFIR